MPSKAELRQKWNSVEKDTVVLHMLPRAKTRPNGSPFVLKLETFLRVAGINYVEDNEQPLSADKGKTPWMTFNGEDTSDSQLCIDKLVAALGKDPSEKLTDVQRAQEKAFRSLVEDNLTWVFATLEFTFAKGRRIRPIFPPLPVPGFLQNFAFNVLTNKIIKYNHAQGMGRNTKEEVEKLGSDALKALSVFLGDKPFFFGNEAAQLDCVVFGFLATVLAGLPDTDLSLKKVVEEELTNLKEFFERMKEKYWSDWDEKLYVDEKQKRKEEEEEKKKKEAEEKKQKEEEEKKKKEEQEEEKKKKKEEDKDKDKDTSDNK